MLELRQTELFKNITQENIIKMMMCTRAITKEYEAGQYIFREEDKPEYLYLILRGSVAVVKDFASGRQDILYLTSEGSVFGEEFFKSDQTRYWFDAVAKEKTVLLLLPWKFFFDFCSNACEHHQQVNKNMLEIMSEKNFYMTKKAHILSSTTLREKISVWLVENAKGDDTVELPMNREQMASYLGVTRPSLSRELMKMQKENLILIEKNKVKILNL